MPTSASEQHLKTQLAELQLRYNTLTKGITALDTDIGRESEEFRKQPLRERRADLATERDQVAAGMAEVEEKLAVAVHADNSVLQSIGQPIGGILFDESHGQDQWYNGAPTIDGGYAHIAAIARQRADIAFLPAGNVISAETLQGRQALVLAMGPQGKTQLNNAEIQSIKGFVRTGGGLLVLGADTGDWHHEANLNQLLNAYGITFNRDVVMPPGAKPEQGYLHGSGREPTAKWAVEVFPAADPEDAATLDIRQALLNQVTSVMALSSCSLYVANGLAASVLQSRPNSVILEPVLPEAGIRPQDYIIRSRGSGVVLAASKTSRVVVGGSWKMFLDAFVDDKRLSNGQLFHNIVGWLLR